MKTKVRDTSLDEVATALASFFTREGGYQEVAKKTGINPQQLYYILSGRNAPTMKTVVAILRSYPEEKALRESLSLSTYAPYQPTADRGKSSDGELDRLKTQLDELKRENYELRMEVRENAKALREIALSNFPESNNHTPVPTFSRLVVVGLVQKHFDPLCALAPVAEPERLRWNVTNTTKRIVRLTAIN